MSTTASPFGARAVYHPSGVIRPEMFTPSTIPSAACYKGDPVKLTGDANVVGIAAAGDNIIGIFDGCEYTDSTGKPTFSAYWPASLSGVTNMKWYVITDINTVFEIQGATGSWADTAIGDSANFVIGAGNANTGISGTALSATLTGAGAVGNFRIAGLAPYQNNAWSDSFPILRVTIGKSQRFAQTNAI
jgi:hypothetical protein